MEEMVCPLPARRRLLLTSVCATDTDRAQSAWDGLVAECGDQSAVLSWINSGPERRVLPLLTKRARELDLTDELSTAATDAMVEAWALNERLFVACAETVDALHREGIEMMVLKGTALVGDVYPEHRLRPVGDLDLLVRPSQARRAFEILKSTGWQPPVGSRIPMRGFSAINLGLSMGASIDLHWRPARDLPHRARRDPLCWERGIELASGHPLAQFGVKRPCTADHVVILAAHIMRATNNHLVHPLADMHFLLEAASVGRTAAVDSRRLADLATAEIARLRTAAVLASVADAFGTPVPVDLRRLSDVGSRAARLERRVVRGNVRGTTDDSGMRATLVHAFYGVQASATGQGIVSKWQVLASSVAAWADVRAGRVAERRRATKALR